jgi:nucleoside-diphosphate-sugar epimerase
LKKKRVIIIGGCGYIGTKLTLFLLKKNYKIKVIDLQLFGNYLPRHPRLRIIKKDIRDINYKDFLNYDSIIHLANIANDPSVDLDPLLSWEVNVLGSYLICKAALKAKIHHVIFSSSGSVYGIKKEKKVTEDLELLPISAYNKTKMIAERIFLSFADKIKIHCIRPATVCGYSPKMRLDLTVNLLSFQALKNKKITVLGGNQIRPNIHIDDLVRVFSFFLENNKIKNGCYNAGFENYSIDRIAKQITKIIPAKIVYKNSNDKRSYRLDSTKLISLGFKKEYNFADAIKELKKKYNQNMIKDLDNCYSIKTLKKINLK